MPPPFNYKEYPPPRDLARWMACFWRIAGRATAPAGTAPHAAAQEAPFPHRVLPDGCADLLFDLEAARHSGGAMAELIGPMSTAAVVELTGCVEVLGVRLRPGVVATFSGVPASELLDLTAPFSLGIGATELAEAADPPAQLRLLADALRMRVAALSQPDRLVRHALDRWVRAESPDFPSISVLTRDLGLSERAFERRFVANVGLTPVGYRRLARFRTVLRLHAWGTRGWVHIAATTGFSDQAHLVRDCRVFTGLTPTEWAATQAVGAGFLQDGDVTTN